MKLQGYTRSPFLCRSTPHWLVGKGCQSQRLIGLLERAVNQAPGGFKGFGRRDNKSYQAHLMKLHLAD